MTHSILFFCGQPVAGTPIGQRIGAFAAYLRRQGWSVALTSVDPRFAGTEFSVPDPANGQTVDIVGPTHFRYAADGSRIQLSPTVYLKECRGITQRLRQRAAGTVVLSTTLPAALYAAATMPKQPQRLWMDVDDWSAGQFTARGGGRLIGTVYGWLESYLPRRCQGLTVCSAELQTVYPRAQLIPNFIRLSEVPSRNPAPVHTLQVAFASGVTAYHGHVPLLQSLVQRRAEFKDVDFWIMGDGDALPECQRLVDQAGLSPQVHFTGRLARPEMLARLCEADIGLLPLWDNRLNRARFPLKLLDYLACGCAMAASDTGMAHAVLQHDQTALLSPAGDMNQLLDNVLILAGNEGLRRRLSTAGRTRVQDYAEDAVCERWMNLLAG